MNSPPPLPPFFHILVLYLLKPPSPHSSLPFPPRCTMDTTHPPNPHFSFSRSPPFPPIYLQTYRDRPTTSEKPPSHSLTHSLTNRRSQKKKPFLGASSLPHELFHQSMLYGWNFAIHIYISTSYVCVLEWRRVFFHG